MRNEKTENLLKLIKQNPTLPIVPMVSGEIAADDCGYWLGEWGNAFVDEYLLDARHDKILFKDDYEVCELLDLYLWPEEYDAIPDDEAEYKKVYDGLPWKKAIVVYINWPDD